MPRFEITAPDGKVFEVDGPEGSTQEQALAQVQAQYKPKEATGLVEKALGNVKSAVGVTPPGMMFRGLQALGEGKEHVAGSVVDAAARAGAPPEVSAALGTATSMAPDLLLGGGFGGTAGRAVLDVGAKRVMQSALKPASKEIANKNAAGAIETMLREGINATTGGAVKLRGLITKLKAEAGKVISGADGALVDKAHVYNELSKNMDEAVKQTKWEDSLKSIERVWDQFESNPLIRGKDKIPLADAIAVKSGTQKSVKDSYGRQTTTPDEDRTEMAIAAGLRKGSEEAAPALAPINKRMSELLNALHQIDPKAAVQANKDLAGLAPFGLAHSPETMLFMMADRNPWMKSSVARLLYGDSLRGALPGAVGTATSAGQQQ